MDDTTIVIRPARIQDEKNIQRLLHSDYRWVTLEEIRARLDTFVLLFCGSQLLSVVCLKGDTQTNSSWTSVHPMYSHTFLADGLDLILQGVRQDQ